MNNSKATRGVEHPIASDMALVGDTKMELHTKPLMKTGPNFGYGAKDSHAKDSDYRVTGDNTGNRSE